MLGSVTNAPRLPQVTSFVRRDDVQSRRQAEPNAADERIREAYAGEIRVGVRPHEDSNVVLRRQKRLGRFTQRRRLSRPNAARSLDSETRVDWRLERADEPTADESQSCRSPASTALPHGTFSGRLHRAQIYTIRRREMIEAFGNAPRSRRRAPAAQFFTQARDQCARISLGRIEGGFERLDVHSIAALHLLSTYGIERRTVNA